MNIPSIQAIQKVYDSCERLSISSYACCDGMLEGYYSATRDLERRLGDGVHDPYWLPVINLHRQHRYYLCGAPLPLGWRNADTVRQLRKLLINCRQVYPDYVLIAESTVDQMARLSASSRNPFVSQLLQFGESTDYTTAALVVKRPALVLPSKKVLASHLQLRHIDILTPNDLHTGQVYSHMFVIGSPNLYQDDEHIFYSPRSSRISFIHYQWFHQEYRPRFAFSVNGERQLAISRHDPIETGSVLGPMIESSDYLPVVDWDRFSTKGQTNASTSNELDLIPAHAIVLADGYMVFLEESEGAKNRIIDPYSIQHTSGGVLDIDYVPNAKIQAGNYILLRTAGGGDYINELADKLLDHKATELRRFQAEWKQALRRKLLQFGFDEVVSGLRDRGSSRANEQNVRNWISQQKIGPGSPRDFRAVLQLVEWPGDFDVAWANLVRIRFAHRQAGREIRAVLLQKARQLDPVVLKAQGVHHLELQHYDAGALSLFRVEDRLPIQIRVMESQLNTPYEIETLNGNNDTIFGQRGR